MASHHVPENVENGKGKDQTVHLDGLVPLGLQILQYSQSIN
jgi:hypothetical protein